MGHGVVAVDFVVVVYRSLCCHRVTTTTFVGGSHKLSISSHSRFKSKVSRVSVFFEFVKTGFAEHWQKLWLVIAAVICDDFAFISHSQWLRKIFIKYASVLGVLTYHCVSLTEQNQGVIKSVMNMNMNYCLNVCISLSQILSSIVTLIPSGLTSRILTCTELKGHWRCLF